MWCFLFLYKADINKSVIKAVDQCLNSHELIKIKFNNYKDSKDDIIVHINKETKSECVGIIGNIAIIFRQNIDIEDRIYKLDWFCYFLFHHLVRFNI